MVEDTQTSNLQQQSAAGATGNPQQVGVPALQTPATSSLQPSGSQSVSSINQLDQGAAAIPLGAVTTTTTVTSPAQQPAKSQNFVYYGIAGILVLLIMGYVFYDLFRRH
jgi:hypothetical protein